LLTGRLVASYGASLLAPLPKKALSLYIMLSLLRSWVTWLSLFNR